MSKVASFLLDVGKIIEGGFAEERKRQEDEVVSIAGFLSSSCPRLRDLHVIMPSPSDEAHREILLGEDTMYKPDEEDDESEDIE